MFLRRILLCGLVALTGVVSAAELSFGDAPQSSGLPGGYVTLPFNIEGSGTFNLEVITPDGWTTLTPKLSVTLDGPKIVPITVQVPTNALAGRQVTIRVQAVEQGTVVAEGEGSIRVEGVSKLELDAPDTLISDKDEAVIFSIRIFNLGNQTDTVVLETETATWESAVSPSKLTIHAYESATAEVSLIPEGQYSDGYRYLLHLIVRSSNNPEVVIKQQVMTTFTNKDPDAKVTTNPQLMFQLETGLSGRLTIADGKVEPSLTYYVAPTLSGDLSDFVDVDARLDPLRGTEDEFFDIPNSTSITVKAESWDASLALSPGRYRFGVGFDAAQWRWSVAGRYTGGVGLNFSAVSQVDNLDLQAFGQVFVSGNGHTEFVGATYRTALTRGLSLEIGPSLLGTSYTPTGGYSLTPGVHQSLSWLGPDFDIRQTYRGFPTAGKHSFGLVGGTRSVSPFGFRAATRLSFYDNESRWHNALSLVSVPTRDLRLSLTGIYSTQNFGQEDTSWSLAPEVRYTLELPFGLRSGFSARYQHTQAISADVGSGNSYSLGMGNSFGDFGLSLGVSYKDRNASRNGGTDALEQLELSAEASYSISARSLIEADYRYRVTYSQPGEVEHKYGIRWEQIWSSDLESKLFYSRSNRYDAAGRRTALERIGVGLAASDVFIEGFQVSAGYILSSDAGMLEQGANFSHNLRFSLGYVINIPFKTPEAVVDIFGGRESGFVSGVAFIDSNLNGVQDAGEEPLSGLTVQLGSEKATTDAQGSFELRVPAGDYTYEFAGLPATLGLLDKTAQTVALNEHYERKLAFAPMTTLSLTLFEDSNRDGVRADGEVGIPYGGVVVEGPVVKRVHADSEGRVYVSGLVAGTYRVYANPEQLPRHFQPTQEPQTVVLEPPAKPQPIAIGAALPERNVVTTFTSGSLSLFAHPKDNTRPAGSELVIEARVQGQPQQVVAEFLGQQVALEAKGATWQAIIRIPKGTASGLVNGVVRASNGQKQVEAQFQVLINDQPPFRIQPAQLTGQEETKVEVETLFKASSVALELNGQLIVRLSSSDGYLWQGVVTPPVGSSQPLKLVIDGQAVADIEVAEAEVATSTP